MFYVGLMVALSAIVGVVTQILIGALSDSSKSKYGRRRPFILFGSVIGGISMCFFPMTMLFSILFFAITYAIIIDIIITFFGDMTTPTRLALLAESTELKGRGSVNAIVGLSAGIGIIMVVAVSGYIVNFAGPDFAFYFGGISMLICGIFCFIICKDIPPNSNEIARTWKENVKETFKMESYRNNKSFYILLFFLFVNAMGAQVVTPYLFIYIESVLGLKGLALAVVLGGLVLMGFLLSFPTGFLLDRFGRKSIMAVITVGAVITSFLFAFVPPNQDSTLILAFFFGGLSVGFTAAIGSTSETWLQDLAPEDRKSSMLAYKIVVAVIPMVPGALLGGFLADFGPKPEGYLYSPIIFIVSALIMLIGLPFLRNIQETIPIKAKEK